jgi:hypothetical protein
MSDLTSEQLRVHLDDVWNLFWISWIGIGLILAILKRLEIL